MLITAGPTHEPIDRVRYLGNRSSGRLGIALAEAAAGNGWQVTLLLGPTTLIPSSTSIRVLRFLTTADLQRLITDEMPGCDVLVMAAAVADYRPRQPVSEQQGKIRRADGPLSLELEPTPDLLAAAAATRRPGQVVVGFALEPRERLMESALGKLRRKSLDMIVANPLETMDSTEIEATVLARGRGHGGGEHVRELFSSGRSVSKTSFVRDLLRLIELEFAGQVAAAPGDRTAGA